MRVLQVLLFFLALSTVFGAKGVFSGTDKNFKSEVVNGGKNSFVKFFAPW